jgi:anti-sigma factor RsiW
MKPCAKNRKRLVWLALDALDAGQTRELRAHLETCNGCRGYLEEISKVSETLNAAGIRTDLEASESFHRRVIGRLRAEASVPFWKTALAQLRATLSNWRVALPVLGATAVVIAAMFLVARQPKVSSPGQTGVQTVATKIVEKDLPPSIANYQMVAHRSLDALDELLTRQGNKVCSPIPIYTASTLALAGALD